MKVDRKTYLGSHDTAALFGLSPYMTKIDVYLNKLGLSEPFAVSPQMEWGLRLERAILDKFEENNSCELEYYDEFYRHSEHNWLGGHPDAMITDGEDSGVDAKCVRFNRGDWGDGIDEVPEHILIQAMHFITLFDAERWHIAVLFGGSDYKEYVIERDEEICQAIIKTGSEFWNNHVIPGIIPECEIDENAAQYLKLKFPDQNDKMIPADAAAEELINHLQETTDCEKRMIKESETIKNQLKNTIGGNEGIISPNAKITWKASKKGNRIFRIKFFE